MHAPKHLGGLGCVGRVEVCGRSPWTTFCSNCLRRLWHQTEGKSQQPLTVRGHLSTCNAHSSTRMVLTWQPWMGLLAGPHPRRQALAVQALH